MDDLLDTSRILFGFGIFMAVLTLLYFGVEIIFRLSPVTKLLVLLSVAVTFFRSGSYVKSWFGTASAYLLASLSYLLAVFYTVFKFKLASESILLVFGASSLIFVGLGYLVERERVSVSRNELVYTVGILLVAVSLVAGADMVSEGVETELRLDSNVTLTGETLEVGTFSVRNSFFLLKDFESPNLEVCDTFRPEADRPVRYFDVYVVDEGRSLIGGGQRLEFPVKFSGELVNETRRSFSLRQVDECPEKASNSTLYVTERNYNLD